MSNFYLLISLHHEITSLKDKHIQWGRFTEPERSTGTWKSWIFSLPLGTVGEFNWDFEQWDSFTGTWNKWTVLQTLWTVRQFSLHLEHLDSFTDNWQLVTHFEQLDWFTHNLTVLLKLGTAEQFNWNLENLDSFDDTSNSWTFFLTLGSVRQFYGYLKTWTVLLRL